MGYVTEALRGIVTISYHITGLFQHMTPIVCSLSLPQREI